MTNPANLNHILNSHSGPLPVAPKGTFAAAVGISYGSFSWPQHLHRSVTVKHAHHAD